MLAAATTGANPAPVRRGQRAIALEQTLTYFIGEVTRWPVTGQSAARS